MSSPTSAASGSVLTRFNPPGYLDDFDETQRTEWSARMNEIFEQVKVGFPQYYLNDGPRDQFFNPLTTAEAADRVSKDISWIGFPRNVRISAPSDEKRWSRADKSRDVQDEYCEWSVHRRADGKISQVDFTCEGPEYWEFLGETAPEKVVELYKKYISADVKHEDLFEGEVYQPRNKWNNTGSGAMHLIQQNNTLYAEIELAAGSSVVRKINGKILTEAQELIRCGQYGGPERNSDPLIGSEVNALARQKARVSLADPVGLYFDTFEAPGWETPDGSDPISYWKILRGTAEHPVRAVYAVPEDKEFTVSDITINGNPIKYGAQIADFVRIKLTGIAQEFGMVEVAPLTACRMRRPPSTPLLSIMSAFDAFDEMKRTGLPSAYSSREDAI